MGRRRSPFKWKRQRMRKKVTALPDEWKEREGLSSGHILGCLSCAKENNMMVLIDIGGEKMDPFFKNMLYVRCPICLVQKLAYVKGKSEANWIWMWIPEIRKKWAHCQLYRSPEDWDPTLTEYV